MADKERKTEFRRGNCGVYWAFENGKPVGRIINMEDIFFEAEGRLGSYETIVHGIYGSDLGRGEVVYDARHGFSCFFIVQHTIEKEPLRTIIRRLTSPWVRCRSFHFYGEKELLCSYEARIIEEEYYGQTTEENLQAITNWDNLEKMIDWMLDKEYVPLPPHDCYLVYDNIEEYKKAKDMIIEKIANMQEGENGK